MILPGNQLYNLILLAFGMLCWGLWANTFRMTSKWRFELYYFDFAVGAIMAALVVGFTAGNNGWDGFSIIDDIMLAGKRQEAFALVAGVVFNLGNMLIVGALSIAGITAAYVIGMGLMLTSAFLFAYFFAPSGNGVLLGLGAMVAVGAAACMGIASRTHSLNRLAALAREGRTKSTRKRVSVKGLVMAAVGGVLAGLAFPVANMAREGDNGLGPYSLGLFFALGLAISTFIFNLFFMNLPIQGDPLEIAAYFKGAVKSHWLGTFGGILWYIGLISLFVVARADAKNMPPALSIRAIMMGSAVVGALFGIFRWRDFANAEGNVKTFLTIALVLFAVGVVALSFSAGSGYAV